MQVLDGRLLAKEIKLKLKQKATTFLEQTGKKPCLAVFLVGEDPASEIYVQQKIKAAKEVGIETELITLSEKTTDCETLQHKVWQYSCDSDTHAILVQLPLPKGWSTYQALSSIEAIKDADGLSLINQGSIEAGSGYVLPCTPTGIMRLFEHYNIALEGKEAVVVGRSQIVGLPMARLLLQAHATVTVCHSRTKDLSSHTKRADIVVVSVGSPGLLSKKDFKKGAVVVDVGLHRIKKQGKTLLVGDVKPEGLENHLSWATPVPGGVGPMTVAMLLENTLTLAERQRGHYFS